MKATRTVAVAGLAAVGLFASSTAAYAGGGTGGNGFRASSCAGNLLGEYRLWRANHTIAHPTARVKVYYSAAGTGSNCVVVLDNTSGSHWMRASIGSYPEAPVNWAADYGTYTTYAGAVGIRGTTGDCVDVEGTIRDNGYEFNFKRWGWCG